MSRGSPGSSSGSRGKNEPAPKSRDKSNIPHIRWDEENIKATYHPPDKDYGFMEIDEPKTPFEEPPGGEKSPVNIDELRKKLSNLSALSKKKEVDRRSKFEEMRRQHYAGMAKAIFQTKDPQVEAYLKQANCGPRRSKERSRKKVKSEEAQSSPKSERK